MARRDEVPAAAHLTEVEMASENAAASVERLARVLHVDVVDPVRELGHVRGRVEELVGEMARVEVDAEALAPVDRVERLPRRHEVVGDLGRMHLEPVANALLVEDVDDRAPAFREVGVAMLDRLPVVRREGVEQVPDARSREPVHLRDAELGRRTGRVGDLLGRALADSLGVAVAPELGGEDRTVALVDRVADALADEMCRDRKALEAMTVEDLPARIGVAGVGERLADVEVVAPASELEPVEAPAGSLLGELLERQVGPLAGEKRDRACHWLPPGARDGAIRCAAGLDEIDSSVPIHLGRLCRQADVDDDRVELLARRRSRAKTTVRTSTSRSARLCAWRRRARR